MKTRTQKPPKVPELIEKGLAHSLDANEHLHRRVTSKQYDELLKLKRERENWERTHKPLFFAIGLSISLLVCIVAFNWKFYDKGNLVDLGEVEKDFDELLEVPLSEQPPPPPPQKSLEVFQIKEVDDAEIIEDINVNLDVEMTEKQAVQDVVYDIPLEVEEEKAEEIFQIVETWPEPDGGIKSFYDYVANNIEYPASARRLNISGVVFVRFVVEKDGSLTDVKVIKGIGAGCDEEAMRVVKSAPAWNPGKQRGAKVRVYMTVPIRFILQER